MQLLHALRLDIAHPIGRIIAFVGAGGKTTAMFQLARELGTRVIVTATSHLGAWQTSLADRHIVAESPEEVGEIPEGVTLVTGIIEGERTQPVNPDVLNSLREKAKRDDIPLLIEADGARQKPLKAPAEHEPPIPDFVDTVIVVAGLSGLGKPLSEEFIFRAEMFRGLSESENQRVGESKNLEFVTPEMLVKVLLHPEGGLKNIPSQARRVALLNQAKTPELQAIGGRMARELLSHFDSVLVGSLQQNNWLSGICRDAPPVLAAVALPPPSSATAGATITAIPNEPNNFNTFEQTAGIILAAGESKRFGKPKQLLDWKGKPFVRQVAETALSAGLSPVVVVTGADGEKVENALAGLDVTIVRNEDWQSGQASSIVVGIKSLPKNSGACLFLLADQPQIGGEIIRALTETHTQGLPAILAPLVLEEKRANPVLFDRITFPDLLQLTGDVGGRAVFSKHKVEYLPWHDDALLLDVDTPEDYERLVGRNDIPPHDNP
jgi:molybdenum cofactor cytidylyltransferase